MPRRTVSDHIREQVTPDLLERLARIKDPIERAQAAGDAVAAVNALRGEVAAARGEAARAMSANGMSWVAIGRELGVSGVRAKAIAEGRERG